jgi:hypothetical protein
MLRTRRRENALMQHGAANTFGILRLRAHRFSAQTVLRRFAQDDRD